jgi:hypothetical protein
LLPDLFLTVKKVVAMKARISKMEALCQALENERDDLKRSLATLSPGHRLLVRPR